MNRHRSVVLVAAALTGFLGAGARPVAAGTCTVLPSGLALIAHIPSAGTKFVLPFPDVGVVIPMDVDAQGVVTMHRGGLPTVAVDTPGPSVEVDLADADATGRLDAGGNVSIPDFHLNTVLFGDSIPTTMTLSTGVQAKLLNNVEYPVAGSQLDFATGIVTLEGADIIPFAPIVSEPVVSGIQITCRLDPVPDPAGLPAAGARLAGVGGTAVLGAPDAGDVLALHARVLANGAALDFSGDVYLRLRNAAGDDLADVLVRGGNFLTKGHRLPAHSVSGDSVKLLAGLKVVQNTPVTAQSALRIAGRDSAAKLVLRVSGLDLAALGDKVRVVVEVAGRSATAEVGVHGAGKRKRLH